MEFIIVDGYVLSVNWSNIVFVLSCIAFYNIILPKLQDILTLVRITLFAIILLKKQQYGICDMNILN